MISVSKSQLKQVEYLLGQSVQGNHVLFELAQVKQVPWAECTIMTAEDAYEVEHHLERLITLPSLPQKKAYVERMDAATLSRVIRTYFYIVENSLFDANTLRH